MEDDTMVTLRSCDGHLFKVKSRTIDDMITLKNLYIDTGDSLLPIPNVKGNVLAKVLEYVNGRSAITACNTSSMDTFNKTFTDDLVLQEALHLIMAANYLDYSPLQDAVGAHIASTYISGKTPEEIRQVLGIQNDFSPEEEEQLKLETQWHFS